MKLVPLNEKSVKMLKFQYHSVCSAGDRGFDGSMRVYLLTIGFAFCVVEKLVSDRTPRQYEKVLVYRCLLYGMTSKLGVPMMQPESDAQRESR